MNQAIDAIFALLSDTACAPVFLMILAIISLLVGRIFNVASILLFAWCNLCLAAAFMASFLPLTTTSQLNGIVVNHLTLLGIKVLLPALMAISLMIYGEDLEDSRKVDSLLLLIISALGGIIAMTSANWMMFFVGIQCLSLPIFGLLALDTADKLAVASGTRYLVLSSISIAFMLFGIALLYAQTGSLDFALQTKSLNHLTPESFSLSLLALGLILVGVAFKLSIAPFHVWAPSVYQGAPHFVLVYLVVFAKSVVILFLLHNAWLLFGLNSTVPTTVLSVMALLSMWIGNSLMVAEQNIKRFLAFLSIGHLGFLLVPVLSQHPLGQLAVVVDLTAFALALVVVLAILKTLMPTKELLISDLQGLAKKNRWGALAISIGLASLAGLPLTAGFVGKYTIIMSGALSTQWFLLGNMVLCSICSIVAIVRVIITLYRPAHDTTVSPLTNSSRFLLIGALAILVLGIVPEIWLSSIQSHLQAY